MFDLRGQSVELASIRQMTDSMKNRGPDDEGFHVDREFGFGMRRLSIIDVKGGHQPIFNEDRSVAVVLNGEIYNYRELRRALVASGHTFATVSDTEVIAHLYEEHGAKLLDHLNGMFGLAVWDSRKRTLLVARDRLGIKPVYVHQTPDRLAFASDLRALRASCECSIDRRAMLAYLANSYVPAPHSIWKEVTKLEPGSLLVASGQGVARRRYWSVPAVPRPVADVGAVREELTHLLGDAVALQLRSDVPVGLMLSGGLDSGTVAAIAAKKLEGMHSFTIDFVGKNSPDTANARQAAKVFGLMHHEITMAEEEAPQLLESLVPQLDEPIADSAIIPSFMISRAARDIGVKVLLSGAGGDEIFGGYDRYLPPRMGSPTWVAEKVPAPLRLALTTLWRLVDTSRAMRASDPLLAWAGGVSGADFAFLATMFRNPDDFRSLVAGVRETFGVQCQAADYGSRAVRGMRIDLATYLPDDVLALNDKTTMAASVEGRVPLLDHRLVEFALGLPFGVNMPDGQQKGLLRSIAKDFLPASIMQQKKDGFSAPVAKWVARALCKPIRESLLGNPTGIISDLIDRRRLEARMQVPNQLGPCSYTLFSLYVLNMWCHVHGSEKHGN